MLHGDAAGDLGYSASVIVRVLLVTAVLAALAPATAHAGTYDVLACGSAGVNHSWTSSVTTWPGNPLQPASFEFRTSCSGGMFVRTATASQQQTDYLGSGALAFDAPAGTAIVAVRLNRYGFARSSSPAPNDGDWWLYAQDASGSQIGGPAGTEQCQSDAHGGSCTIGSAGGSDTGVLRVGATSRVSWGVLCAGQNLAFCNTNDGTGPLAELDVHAATVTLEDDGKPTLSTSGDLLSPGWRRATDALTWSSSDASGIRTVQLLVDGVERARVDEACDATRPVPCPAAPGGTLSLAGAPIADGTHALTVAATDAAGNTATQSASVAIDANPPDVVLRRASGRTIAVQLSDGASGVASGSIEVRDAPGAPFRPLPATLANGRLTATLDHGSAARVGIRVSASDNAGNAVSGQVVEMALSARGRTIHGGRVSVGYGRQATFSGRLRTRDGVALAGQPVQVERTLHQTGASPQVLRTVTTDARGGFSFRAAAGPSRQLRFIYGGAPDLLHVARVTGMRVRATSTIHAAPRVVGRGGRVRFSGRLGLQGAAVPRSGKLVDLQAFDRGRWRTFATARARGSKGAWRSPYRFGSTPGRYRIRLRIRREAAFPYDLGYSPAVIVRVR